MKTLVAIAVLVLSAVQVQAAPSKSDLVAVCESVDVPESILPKCVKDFQNCTAKKTLKQCEAELISPDAQ